MSVVRDALRRLIAIYRPLKAPPAAVAGARPAAPRKTGASARGVQWLLPKPPQVQMRWQKEQTAGPSGLDLKAWEVARRLHERQRRLVILGTGAVLIMVTWFATGLFTTRSLPREVRGVWRTDAPNYETRRFELRKGLVVLLEGDSANAKVTTHAVRRVWSASVAGGSRYDVQYETAGQPIQFSFVYLAGPPERIRFANQPNLIWTRMASVTLLPGY